jgi:hypothetical protein
MHGERKEGKSKVTIDIRLEHIRATTYIKKPIVSSYVIGIL